MIAVSTAGEMGLRSFNRLLVLPATVSRSALRAQRCVYRRIGRYQLKIDNTTLNTAAISGQGQVLPQLVGQMSSFNPPRTLEETLEVVRTPPTGRNVGPRVEHIEVTADGQLSGVIATALQLPTWFALELLRFGAVHHSPIMPNPAAAARPFMPPEHLERVEQLIAAGRAKLGRNPKLQHPKRVLEDMPVGAGGYVRVHVHPKRFPAAYSVDWKQQILAEMPEYVVVNKPAGVQVSPTVDNVLESVVCCTAQALGLPQPHSALLNTHRLDAGTSGVVVLAKNSQFANWFSSLLKSKPDNIVKVYKCLTSTPPPVGRMVHYAVVKNRALGEPAHTRMRRPTAAAVVVQEAGVDDLVDVSGSSSSSTAASSSNSSVTDAIEELGAYCELNVLQVHEVSLTRSAASEWGSTAYESTIQLVTGRTHQIRAQMAAEGCPLLGDHLYEALATRWQQEQQQAPQCGGKAASKDEIQQQQQQQQQLPACLHNALSTEQAPQQQHSSFTGAEWSRVYQEDPLKPIGLQAHALRIRDIDGRMTAGAVAQQQQQQQQPAQTQGQQQGVQWSGQSAGHCYSGVAGSAQTAVSSSGLTLTSRDGTPGARENDTWVEFCAGVPWWHTH